MLCSFVKNILFKKNFKKHYRSIKGSHLFFSCLMVGEEFEMSSATFTGSKRDSATLNVQYKGSCQLFCTV